METERGALARQMMGGYKGAKNEVKWQGCKIFVTMLGYEQRAKVCCASEVFSCEV